MYPAIKPKFVAGKRLTFADFEVEVAKLTGFRNDTVHLLRLGAVGTKFQQVRCRRCGETR